MFSKFIGGNITRGSPNRIDKSFLSDLPQSEQSNESNLKVFSTGIKPNPSPRGNYVPSYRKGRPSVDPKGAPFPAESLKINHVGRGVSHNHAIVKTQGSETSQRHSPKADLSQKPGLFFNSDSAKGPTNQPFNGSKMGELVYVSSSSNEKIEKKARLPIFESRSPMYSSFIQPRNQEAKHFSVPDYLSTQTKTQSFIIAPQQPSFSLNHSKSNEIRLKAPTSFPQVPLTQDDSLSPSKSVFRTKKAGIKDFEVIKHLGRGSYADVFLVKSLLDGKIYAMKKIDRTFLQKQGKEHQVFIERIILEKFKHNGIVRLYATFQTANSLCSILEFIEGGEFSELIKNHLSKTSPF